MSRFVASAAIIIATLVIASCNNSPTAEKLTGNVSGYVALVNADGTQLSNRDSVIVTIDQTNYSTMTDSTGYWVFPNIQEGIYTVTYSKAGFGYSKSMQVQFTGGGDRDVGYVYLCKPPTFSTSAISQRAIPKGGDSASVYISSTMTDTSVKGVVKEILFFGKDTAVSWNPAKYTDRSIQTLYCRHGVDTSSIRLTSATLVNSGFVSGDTVYIAAYTASNGSNNSGYTDLATGHTVFTDIDTVRSNVLKVVMP